MRGNEKKNRHMTLEERTEIEECLSKETTFKAIAKRIGKSQTTVSREVKARKKEHISSFVKTEGVSKAPFTLFWVFLSLIATAFLS